MEPMQFLFNSEISSYLILCCCCWWKNLWSRSGLVEPPPLSKGTPSLPLTTREFTAGGGGLLSSVAKCKAIDNITNIVYCWLFTKTTLKRGKVILEVKYAHITFLSYWNRRYRTIFPQSDWVINMYQLYH